MSKNVTGVLLLAFGGPDSPEAIEPFMKNLMGGRTPPPPLVEKVKARYGLIGGKSPLPEITRAQAGKLEDYLRQRGNDCPVAVGMRYWHPFIEEGVNSLLANGVTRIIALSLAPFYSQVSTGAYQEELRRVVSASGQDAPEVILADPLYKVEKFVEAVAEKVSRGLEQIPEGKRGEVRIIFSAHSLPVSYIQEGDPYVSQFEDMVNRVAVRLGLAKWHLAYQSKGGGQGEWLGPMVEDIMEQAAREGAADVLVVPAGFVSDHIETLYDIDIAQKNHAVSLGLNFYRTESLNTSSLFIQALAEAAKL